MTSAATSKRKAKATPRRLRLASRAVMGLAAAGLWATVAFKSVDSEPQTAGSVETSESSNLTPATPNFTPALTEANYEAAFRAKVAPFVTARGQVQTFTGEAGIKINSISFVNPQSKGTIVIAEGYNESARKYSEMAYDLFQNGYSVYLFDHRGQGDSGRFLADSQKAYIDHFENLVLDLKAFVDKFVPKKSRELPRYLIAHSLGGAVGALYLETYRDDFNAAVLSCPMLTINFGQPEWAIESEAAGLALIGRSEQYAPSTGPFDPLTAANTVSHSQIRYMHNEQILVDHPEVFVAGETVHWIDQALQLSRKARADGKKVTTPVLLFQAGEDSFVLPEGEDEFCHDAPGCSLVKLANSKHEIFQETDSIRNQVFATTLQFLSNHNIDRSLKSEPQENP